MANVTETEAPKCRPNIKRWYTVNTTQCSTESQSPKYRKVRTPRSTAQLNESTTPKHQVQLQNEMTTRTGSNTKDSSSKYRPKGQRWEKSERQVRRHKYMKVRKPSSAAPLNKRHNVDATSNIIYPAASKPGPFQCHRPRSIPKAYSSSN